MIAVLAALALALPQEEKFSGPQKGEKTTAFKVFDVGARREVDLVAEWNGAPTLLVFIHELTRPGAALLRALDEHAQIKQVRGLKTLFVSLAEDRDGAERRLPQVVKSLNLKSPLGISVDGKEGPGAYGLNRDVTLTILVARDNKVAANFAIVAPNETDAPRIKAAVDAAVAVTPEGPAGTPEEMKVEIARLREEILRLKEEIAAIRLQLERPPAPARPRMPAEDEKLVGLCRRLIQAQATEADLEAAVADIEAYIAGKDELRRQYAGILGRVLELKYGNEAGQAVMRRQLEKHGK